MPASGAAAIGEDTAAMRPKPASTMRGASSRTTLSEVQKCWSIIDA